MFCKLYRAYLVHDGSGKELMSVALPLQNGDCFQESNPMTFVPQWVSLTVAPGPPFKFCKSSAKRMIKTPLNFL